jgi:hypothetical protein
MNCDFCDITVTKSNAELDIEHYRNKDRLRSNPNATALALAESFLASNAPLDGRLTSNIIPAAMLRVAVLCGLNPFTESGFEVGHILKEAQALGLTPGDSFQEWSQGLFSGQIGGSDWRLCSKCGATFDSWWKSHVVEKTFTGSDMGRLKDVAQREGYIVDHPVKSKDPIPKVVKVKRPTEKEAIDAANAKVPGVVLKIAPAELTGGEKNNQEVFALDEAQAWDACREALGCFFKWVGDDWATAKKVFDEGPYYLDKVELLQSGKPGFLGIGRKQAVWRVVYHSEYCAVVKYTEPGSLTVARRS